MIALASKRQPFVSISKVARSGKRNGTAYPQNIVSDPPMAWTTRAYKKMS